MPVVPDAKVTLEDVVATDDAVVLRRTWGGTHGGEFLGAPPTNKPVRISGWTS
jgi:predicted ester cyclase